MADNTPTVLVRADELKVGMELHYGAHACRRITDFKAVNYGDEIHPSVMVVVTLEDRTVPLQFSPSESVEVTALDHEF